MAVRRVCGPALYGRPAHGDACEFHAAAVGQIELGAAAVARNDIIDWGRCFPCCCFGMAFKLRL